MVPRISLAILHYMVTPAHAKELEANHTSNRYNSKEKFADRLLDHLQVSIGKTVGQFVENSINLLFGPVINVSPAHHADLDATTLGKRSQFVTPAHGSSRRLTVPSSSHIPARSFPRSPPSSLPPYSCQDLAPRDSVFSGAGCRSQLSWGAIGNGNLQQGRFSVLTLAMSDADVAPAVSISNSLQSTSHALYNRLRRRRGRLSVRSGGDDDEARAKSHQSPSFPKEPSLDGGEFECSIENLEACTPSQMEGKYVDVLWHYYAEGKQTLSDEQFEQLQMELSWEGSGFLTLGGDEVRFAKAALAYARGEPLLSDTEYEKLKKRIKSNSKRKEAASFLIYVKGFQNLNAEEFEKLSKEMDAQGMPISPSRSEGTVIPSESTITVLRIIGLIALIEISVVLSTSHVGSF